MIRLRTRLIAAFLAATLAPLLMTWWVASSLLEHSLTYSATEQVDRLSKSLEAVGHEYYLRACDTLRKDAASGVVSPLKFVETRRRDWPEPVAAFWESGELERCMPAGDGGERLDHLVRQQDAVWLYSSTLGPVRMEDLAEEYRTARDVVRQAAARDLRRGFTTTLVLLMAAIWVVSLAALIYFANRLSRPIQQLTAGLSELAAGNLGAHIDLQRRDEVGRAIEAFNTTARELQQSRDRLVYLTQIASWQLLARKTAHELKNSLTPIRLTVEEIVARQPEGERAFMEQAARIVIQEVETLERRVRAFSEFSSEPEPCPQPVALRGLLEERIALLRPGHPDLQYDVEIAPKLPAALADPDHVKGILTNLLENAADAAGSGGRILTKAFLKGRDVCVEVHDSGPGLSGEAARMFFEPTITFKKGGMGLGLLIARKNALLCGGDLVLIDGALGGAGFRLTLPAENNA